MGFILRFTVIFVLLGALAGTFGRCLTEYNTVVNLITGLIVIFFGLNFFGIFRISLFKGTGNTKTDNLCFLFRFIRCCLLNWMDVLCRCFSGVGFDACHKSGKCHGRHYNAAALFFRPLNTIFVSAVLIDRLKGAFSFIKRHYRVINIVSGVFFVAIGILMTSGLFGRFLALLS